LLVLANIATFAFYILVATRAKGLVAGTGQHHNIDVLVFAADAHGITHFGGGGWCEGIVIARPVDGNPGDAFPKVEKYFLVFFNCFPISFFP